MEHCRNDINGGTPVPLPRRPRVKELESNPGLDSERSRYEPMNAVADFLVPDIVLPPTVSILIYVQLIKAVWKSIYDDPKRQTKPALTGEQPTKEVTYS
jgi:hypothetical protein